MRNSSRSVDLLSIYATGILGSIVLGALINSINGLVSPHYFVAVYGWNNVSNVWRASIAYGMMNGGIFGAIFSLIFILVVGTVSKSSCPYRISVRYVLGTLGAALACWVVNGLRSIGTAIQNPEYFQTYVPLIQFRGAPHERGELIKYAWVAGSINGMSLGGFCCFIGACVIFNAKWKRQHMYGDD